MRIAPSRPARPAGGARADALVLDLDTRAGLWMARTLGRAGLCVAVAASDGSASGLRTRYAADRVVLPRPAEDFPAYVAAVVDAAERTRAAVVLTSVDFGLAVLHRHRALLARVAVPAVGAIPAVETASDKERTLAVAHALGVRGPRSLLVRGPAEAQDALAEVGLPAVLKPARSWRPLARGSERVEPALVASPEEGRRAAEALVRPDAPALVQELAPGQRETVKLFRVRGRVVARLTMEVDRSWPALGGSSVMRRTVPPTDTLALAERLVAELDLDGYSEVEFRRDAAGVPLLMEVNPRLSQSVEVAGRAGVDFTRMQLEWARGGAVRAATRSAIGVRVGWLAGDGRLLASALVGGPPPRPAPLATARAVLGDYVLRGAEVEGWDRRDPAPTLGALAFTTRAVAARAGASRRR